MNNLTNDQILELALVIGKLKRVKRTGWIVQGVKDAESVAEHTFRVAFLSLLLSSNQDIDQLKLIKMALVHDLGEAVIGDIKWEEGSKIIASQEDKHKDEKVAIKVIFGKGKNLREYIEYWEDFAEQKSEEAKFLKQIDKIEMAIQALEYQEEGNDPKSLVQFWENAGKHLKGTNLEMLFKSLLDQKDK